jgi:hypothetical protein
MRSMSPAGGSGRRICSCHWRMRRGMRRLTSVRRLASSGGVERKVHFFAFDLPPDACSVTAYPAEAKEGVTPLPQ